IQSALQQLEHYDMTHVNVISNLANTYRQSISPLGPKIIIKGEQSYLSNPDNASRIRALLLAGIRAVLLWRQAGGNRWRLFSERNAMLKEIKTMISQVGSSPNIS
ncbi:MAG: lysogenization regulator HflD, partial [Chloroflexi bacterium]|nr:lysogenization regulator HflD [Chloroflexota bacterium]